MNIKKAYKEIVDHLRANKDVKVGLVLADVERMAASKTSGGNNTGSAKARFNDAGDVTHVFCYYHKKWEDVKVADYGARASSPTGLNNMCKEGVGRWTKQQAAATKAKNDLLVQVTTGEVNASDLGDIMADIEHDREVVVCREDKHGVDEDSPAKTEKPALKPALKPTTKVAGKV